MAFNLDSHKELTQITTRQDTALGIMRWGSVNAFPQTLQNLINQSPISKPAVTRTAKFYAGSGFEGENQIVNETGITLKQVVAFAAREYAEFGGFAIQCNYNMDGEVSSLTPLSMVDLRLKELDELYYSSKLGYHPNFGSNSNVKKNVEHSPTSSNIKFLDRFNPNEVLTQIDEAGGNSKYNGQILYVSNAGFSQYPIPPLQSAINYVLSDVENSILVRKETSTGFINSYILKTTMDSEDPSLKAMERALSEAQGARGTGKIITFSGLAPEDVQSTLLEEIGSGSAGSATAIKASRDSYELSRDVILGSYLIPPILGGSDQNTGFTTSELTDAYFVFNATTKEGRDLISNEISRVLAASVFPIKSIKIKKLELDLDEENDIEDISDEESVAVIDVLGSLVKDNKVDINDASVLISKLLNMEKVDAINLLKPFQDV